MHELTLPQAGGDPERSQALLFELIERLLKAPKPEGQALLGIGIGAPGITNSNEGIVIWTPGLGWRDLPLKAILGQQFNLPVAVENDVNLAALGEYGFGAGRGVQNLVCIAIGTGISSGIIVDGRLVRDNRSCMRSIRSEINYCLGNKASIISLTNLVELQAGKRGDGDSIWLEVKQKGN